MGKYAEQGHLIRDILVSKISKNDQKTPEEVFADKPLEMPTLSKKGSNGRLGVGEDLNRVRFGLDS